MITALVQFKLPQPISTSEARGLFMDSAPNFRTVPGLLRKYFLLSEDGATAGGVYLWESREQAEQMYTRDWLNHLQSRFGSVPTVTWFDSPVVVDNVSAEIISA
ncbi:MAG: monooxygenase [Gammaproteobacteria bacterium]|nr:monooxygenase [Gammaproteobacteria bacterium]